jgi:long-chain-fatty-acid--CoA ligase ACSBG
VVCEGNKQLKKYIASKGKLPYLKAIVVWGEAVDESIAAQIGVKVYSWEDFLKLGASVNPSEVDDLGKSMAPGNCASLIYTSGGSMDLCIMSSVWPPYTPYTPYTMHYTLYIIHPPTH